VTGVVGILIQPWKLVADPTGYIFTWLVAYSALLGAVGGVLIADYYLVRRTRLDLAALYRAGGQYWFVGGVNPRAVTALALGIAPCVPGFLAAVGRVGVPDVWVELYYYAWFLSFVIALATYVVFTKLWPAG
jgi:NCS1 family nucleobase:cation symporter-1